MWRCVLLLLPLLCGAQRRLERHNIDRRRISVSGLSSGACMASQFHVIHSRTIMGAAIFAGAPYGCADVHDVVTCMSDPGGVSVGDLLRNLDETAGAGTIDPVSSLRGDRVYVFNGRLDSVVNRGIGQRVRDFYQQVPVASVASELNLDAEHGFPTVDRGVPCTQMGGSFINRCNYDGAFMALNQIYRNLLPPVPAVGQLYQYDQEDFFWISPPEASAMDTVGYIYVPTGCQDKTRACSLHIALHGCQQGRLAIGEAFVRDAGYNEVAEANDVIILYPQAIATLVPVNPQGCWDWWGYTLLYNTKDGPQILAIKRMIDRLVDGS